MIQNLVGVLQGTEDYILFTLLSCDENSSLQIQIDKISDQRWHKYTHFVVGGTYIFKRHFNSNEPPFDMSDPMELWECLSPNQKEDETILPQILLYFWHKGGNLSMELDW